MLDAVALQAAANLPSGRLSLKQAAKLMNVSERSVRMACELRRTGRVDLCEAVEDGRMSLFAALKAAKPQRWAKRRGGLAALHRAWGAATEGERLAFLDHLAD